LKENGIFIISPPNDGYIQLFRFFNIKHGKKSYQAKTKTKHVLSLLGSYVENHPDIDLIHVPDYKDHPKIKKFEEEYLSKWNKPQFEDLYPGTHFCVFQKKKMQS